MVDENGKRNAVEIARLGEKMDAFTELLKGFIDEQRKFNHSISKRIDELERTTERWKGIWIGGIGIVTAIFSLINLILKMKI